MRKWKMFQDFPELYALQGVPQEKILPLVKHHLKPIQFYKQGAKSAGKSKSFDGCKST